MNIVPKSLTHHIGIIYGWVAVFYTTLPSSECTVQASLVHKDSVQAILEQGSSSSSDSDLDVRINYIPGEPGVGLS
jgi:hypothetical protein